MTRKERMRRAIRREPVDHLPFQTNYTGAMGRRMAEHFGVEIGDLPARLYNHLLRVDIAFEKTFASDGSVAYDWWGAGWDARTEGYWHASAPLAESLDLDGFRWPDP